MESLEEGVAATLIVLRRRINTYHSHIYCLHSEIHSQVAFYLPNHGLIETPTWRDILLSSPRLWAAFSFLSEKETEVFIELSKSASISTFADIPLRYSHEAAMRFSVQHATRIETLTIAGVPWCPISYQYATGLEEVRDFLGLRP